MPKTELSSIPIVSEISLVYNDRRRRGWVAERSENGHTVVRLYPIDESEDFEIQNPSQVRLLKIQEIPQGWNAVDLAKEDGSPWISLRFDDRFWDYLLLQAERSGRTPEETFMSNILLNLDQREKERQ